VPLYDKALIANAAGDGVERRRESLHGGEWGIVHDSCWVDGLGGFGCRGGSRARSFLKKYGRRLLEAYGAGDERVGRRCRRLLGERRRSFARYLDLSFAYAGH